MSNTTTPDKPSEELRDPIWPMLMPLVCQTDRERITVCNDCRSRIDAVAANIAAHTQTAIDTAVEQNHARVAYSPYVDTFTFWDTCLDPIKSKDYEGKGNSYISTKQVEFITDDEGVVMWLQVRDLHTGAQLTSPPVEHKAEETT